MSKRKRRGLVFVLLAAVLLAGGGYLALRSRLQPANPAARFETAAVERGDVAETIGQTGTVLARQSAEMNWKTSGKIAEVMVKAGDVVQAGQALARLEPLSMPPDVLLKQVELSDAESELATLQQSEKARADAQAALYNAEKAYEQALDDRALLDQPNASPANIEGAQATYDAAQVQLNQAEAIYSLFENRPEDDVQRLQAAAQLELARRQLRNAEWNLQYATNKPDQQTAAIVNSDVAVAEASLKDARREWQRVKDGPDPEDLQAAQARIDAARAALSVVEIRAPFDATVTQLFANVGDLVRPDMPAARLDDMRELSIEVGVPEVDINRVKTGQIVSIIFDAIPGRSYLGRVTQVEDAGSSNQDIVNFPVHITLVDEDGAVRPGMTAAVSIIVNQVEDVLLAPNRAIRFLSGQRVVYVLRGEQQVRLPVTVGIADEAHTQIISDEIKEGDLIILNPVVATPAP